MSFIEVKKRREMREYLTVTNNVKIEESCDVIVVGAGVAGIAAAVSAARLGKSVMLFEKGTAMGGLATLGHVCVYLPICDGLGHKVYGGMAEELLWLTFKYSYNTLPDCWSYGVDTVENPKGRYATTFNIPAFILTLEEYVKNEGVKVLYDCVFSEPIMEGGVCKGIIVESKSGRSAYMAKMVVDATGDADVMYRAGADTFDTKSIVSHWTYEIDKATLEKGLASGKALDAIRMRWFGLRPDMDNSKATIPTFYGTSLNEVNGYISLAYSLALDYLKEHQTPDYAMLTWPVLPQYRMTRRITGMEQFIPNEGYKETSVGCISHSMENPAAIHEFPYGAILDAKLPNIAAAGRLVAAVDYGWEIVRVIPCCVFTGQVAGTAASLAIDQNCALQEVKIDSLQSVLAETGITIHRTPEMLTGVVSEKKFRDPKYIKGDPHSESLKH